MDPCHLLRRGLKEAIVSFWLNEHESDRLTVLAKLFETLTFLPSFCPNNTPTTRFLPLPDLPK